MVDIQEIKRTLAGNGKLITGMKKYRDIMDLLHQTNVSTNKDFQRMFNNFFVMRSRKAKYYDMFYSFLEEHKDTGALFEETLEYLRGAEGRLEVSFSSKLIHVINPNRPIWDNNVAVQHFKMKVPGYGVETEIRQKEIIRLYHEYCSRFYEYLDLSEGQMLLQLFNDAYPDTNFTDAKKLDFILWADVGREGVPPMTKEEKIKKIQYAIDHPNAAGQYYKLLEDMGDLRDDYGDYMTTEPINCDKELERLPEADYKLAADLLIMLLREDHFSNGSFRKRLDSGQVNAVLKRMICQLD